MSNLFGPLIVLYILGLCFALTVQSTSYKSTSFLASDCTGDWSDPLCWSNGLPSDGDSVYLLSCYVSSVDLPPMMSLSYLQIGSPDCPFHIQLSSGEFNVSDLHFVSGSLAGSGTLFLTGQSSFDSSASKNIDLHLHNSGSLTISHTSASSVLLRLHDLGSLINTGILSVLSDTTISSLNYDSPSFFTNEGLLLLDDDAHLLITTPFSNDGSVLITSGTLSLSSSSLVSALGSFEVYGQLLFDSTSPPSQSGALLQNGTIEISSMFISGASVVFNVEQHVLVQNLTIEGNSSLSGGASITVNNKFYWYEGVIDNVNLTTSFDAQCFLISDRTKILQESTLSMNSFTQFGDNCTISFDDSHLYLNDFSTSEFLANTNFLHHNHSEIVISSVNLLGKSTATDCSIVFEPELNLNNHLNATSTNLFIRNDCEVSGTISFNGKSRLVFQDNAWCVFDESSIVSGPLTSLEGSRTHYNVSSHPVVEFFGLWALNSSVSIDFGYFYFRESSNFNISSLHVSASGRLYFFDSVDDEHLTWDLSSVVSSGSLSRIYFGGLHRNVSIDYLNVDHGYIEIWVRTVISFPDSVSATGGQLYVTKTPNVWLNELVIQSNALFRTNECENLHVETLRSTDSRVTFQSNPDSIRIDSFDSTNTLINSDTGKTLFISSFELQGTSEVSGVDDFDILSFVFESGVVDVKLFTDFATLTSVGLKTLGVFHRNAPSSITVRKQGHWSGGRLSGFAGSYLRVNSEASFEISTNEHLHYDYLRNTPSYNISNAPRLFVHGYVNKTSTSTMRMDFRPIVYNGGKFELQSGEVRFTAGGVIYGDFNSTPSTTLSLLPSRTLLAQSDSDRHVHFRSSSSAVILGSVNLDMYSVWTVAGSLEISDQVFSAGSIFFVEGFSLKASSWTCSQFCKIVAEKAIGDVSFEALNLLSGSSVVFHDFSSSILLSLGNVVVNRATLRFSTNVIVEALSFDLRHGILEGTDHVTISSEFAWGNGRIGSMKDLSESLSLTFSSTSVNKIYSNHQKHLKYDSSITNDGELYLIDNHRLFTYTGVSITNNGFWHHGSLCGGSLCDNLSGFVYRVHDLSYTSHNLRGLFTNTGTFVKLSGTFSTTNELRFVQTLSGHFIFQSSQFTQSPSNSDLDGQFDFWPGTIFSVGSSTSLVRETARFDGLQGRLRTISGGAINFNGYYNLTLNFNHNIGTFNFLNPSDLELDSIHVTGGLLRFYNAKERPTSKNLFDLNTVSLTTAGTLRFINVEQPMEIGSITQSGTWVNPYLQAPRRDDSHVFFDSTDHYLDIASINSHIGSIRMTQIGDYLALGDVTVRNSTLTVIGVTSNTSFGDTLVSDTGLCDVKTLGDNLEVEHVDVHDGIFVIDDVTNNATFKDFLLTLSASFSITKANKFLNIGTVHVTNSSFIVNDVGSDVTFSGDFLVEEQGSGLVTNVGQSIYTSGSFLVYSELEVSNVGGNILVNTQLLCSDANLLIENIVGDSFSPALSPTTIVLLLFPNIQEFVISDYLFSNAFLSVEGYSNSFVNNFTIESGTNLFSQGSNFFNVNSLVTSGTLTVETIDTVFINSSVYELFSFSTFIDVLLNCSLPDVVGTGGMFEIRNTPKIQISNFAPNGTYFLFNKVDEIFDVPSFSIHDGSTVELRAFEFEPVLFDIQITQGRLRLNSTETVHIDHLLVNGVSGGRDGRDLAIVYFGVDYEAGWFQDGRTESLYPLMMTTSKAKHMRSCQLISPNSTTIDVEGGIIHGYHGALLELYNQTMFIGDFHFATTMTGASGSSFPLIRNTDTFIFSEFDSFRLIHWEVDLLANTTNTVLNGSLSLGRGGGFIDTSIILCSNCTLNFNSDLDFNSSLRTYHEFTSNAAISCPTCRVNFETDGAWVKFSGIFDLDPHHVQNFGRLEFLDTALVPITHWTLENCDVHFLKAQLFQVSPGDVYVLADTVLNRCGRLVITESRYALEFIDLHISGGLLEITDQQHSLNTTVTLIDGNGAFRIENLLHPLIGEGFIINNGYLRLDTGHNVSLQFINMSTPHPDDVVSFTCLSSIGYSAFNSPNRHNITGLYGTDDVEINDLNWLGGSIEVGRLDIFETLYSDKADDRGLHGFGMLYIHTLAYLGGPGDIYVSGPVHWYILPDSEVNIHSTLNFKSDSDLENYLYNDGDLFFPIENSVIELHFEVHQRHLYESHQNVTVIYNGPSYSSGDYILHPKSRLLLNYFNHNFDKYVQTTGSGNIHMHQWYFTQNNDWKNLTVVFDGRWEASTFYEQDYGRWIFGPHAFLNITDVQLTQRTHTTIDNSRPASGNWTFDLFSIAVNSWFVFTDFEDGIVSRKLIMSSDAFIRFRNSQQEAEFVIVELYDGEVEFSTGHNLHFRSLIVDGGTLSGSDTITVDSFIWRCGRIEGDSDGVSATIHILSEGFIETCKTTLPSNPNPDQKQLLHDSILNFRSTSVLMIDTTNYVSLNHTSSINVRGTATMRAAMFVGTDRPLNFIDSLVTTEGSFDRVFLVWVDFNQNSILNHTLGTITFSNQLDVYGHFHVSNNTEILFNQPLPSSRYEFHKVSRLTETVEENPVFTPILANFEPTHGQVNVFVMGQFDLVELSYSIGTVTFTGPIALNIGRIRLEGTALVHFDDLDNDLGSVRGFDLSQNSVMKFSSGLEFVTFDGAGLLTGNAEIIGYGDNVLIIPILNGASAEFFSWSGGSISGDIIVDVFSQFEIIGNSDKRLRGGASVVAHVNTTWTSSGHMTGFDKSRLIVSKTGELQFASSGGFSCRTSTSYFIDDPCVCDSELIINGSVTVVPFTQRVTFCWGITVNGEINVNFGRIEAYSYLSGNGQFNVGSLGRIWFVSNSMTSYVEPESNFHADGQISLLYDTVVYIQGIFYSSVDVSIRNGTLIFDDDAFLVRRFDLSVETGDAIFKVVEQMSPLGAVTCQNGDVTFNTLTIVNISTLNLIAGMVHGYDEVHILQHLNWQGGGFGLSTHYVVRNSATALVTGIDHDRYMLPNAKIINQGQFEFREPFVLTPTEVLFINDFEGDLTLTNSLSFMDSSWPSVSNTLINYGDIQCNLVSLQMRFKFSNNGSVSVNSGEFYAEGGALSYGQLYFSPGTNLKVNINPVILENYPTSTVDGGSFTFDIIHNLGLISVRNYFTSTDFTVKSTGHLVFEAGAVVSTFSDFNILTTFVTFETQSNVTARGQLLVNDESTTTIRGIHNGHYHGIITNSYLLYDDESVLSGLLDFTIHTGDVEFKAVTEMLQMDEVTCINGDLTFNTHFIVNITSLNLIAGMVYGYDEVHILQHLNWQGGGFGLSTHYVVRNSATALVTGIDHDRYMLPNAKIINQGQFEFREPFVLTPTEVLFINDFEGILTLTNSLSFMDSSWPSVSNTLINYGDIQCNLVSLQMRFKFSNNGSVSVNSGEFYAEGGALSYGQLYFSPGTILKVNINPVIFENYPTSTVDGKSFTFDIIHNLGFISVRNYFTSTDFTVKSTGHLVFEAGAVVSTFSDFNILTTFVIFETQSNFTARGQLLVNDQSTTTIRGVHNGHYHGIISNSYLLYDDASVLSGLLDFTIHTGDVEFKAVTEMLQMDEVTCINGDLTLNTHFIVNISTLNLIAGMVYGYDEVHLLEYLNWQGGGFGLSTHYVVLNSATALVTGIDHDRYMLPNAKIINQGQFEFKPPITLLFTEVLFINDHQGVLTLTNSLSFMDSSWPSVSNTLVNYGDIQCNLASLQMRFKFLNNGSVSVNSGEFFAESGALSYGQFYFSPETTLKANINPVIFENYPTSTIDGELFTFDIIHSLGLISVRNYFNSTDFTVKSTGHLVFEAGAVVSTFSDFNVLTTFVTFDTQSNFTGRGQLLVNDESTTIIRGIHSGHYHGIITNSYLLYDDESVLSGLLDFTIHTGDVEFKAVTEMLQMNEVTCINGDLTLNTDFIVDIFTLNLIAGMVHGYDEVHLLEHLNWQGGGFGVSTHYVVLNQAILDEDHDAPRVMLNFSLLVNRGRMDVFGLLTIRGSQATIMNDHSGLLTFYNYVDLLDLSKISHSKLQNYGELVSSSHYLNNEFYFINHGFTHITSGEISLAGGGYSLGKVQCDPATAVGVLNLRLKGSHFLFAIRRGAGVIEVQTLLSLRNVRIQDHGLFYVTSGAYITDDVSLIVRGTHVIFEGFENPEVNFESLQIETNGIVSFNTGHNVILKSLLIIGGFRGGTDVVNVLEQFTWRLGGGFMHAGLTIAEKGCIIQDFFEKEVRDFATVEFQGPVEWLQHCDIRGGRNSSLIFNDILIVKDGGKFENYIGRFNDRDIFFLSSTHHTPDDLPTVYLNHELELYASGWSFEFDWELQNTGNITVPEYFTMKLFSGGYDSASSRVLFEPGSSLQVGAPYPYYYNEDTWVYYSRSSIQMMSPNSFISFNGFICFVEVSVGPFGTLVLGQNATLCPYASLIVDGTDLVIEGDASFCHLTIASGTFGKTGSRLTITCSLTWLSGSISQGSLVYIASEASLFVSSTSIDSSHHLLNSAEVSNNGHAFVTEDFFGHCDAIFSNFGNLQITTGNWVLGNDSCDVLPILYNFENVTVTASNFEFYWNIFQHSGNFYVQSDQFHLQENAVFRGYFLLSSLSEIFISKELTFDDCIVSFDSSKLTPLETSVIDFTKGSVLHWNEIDFTLECLDCSLIFSDGCLIGTSPTIFEFKTGFIFINNVSVDFHIEHLHQTGGTFGVNPAYDTSLIGLYVLAGGDVVTNSSWIATTLEWKAGTFTGSDTFTASETSIFTPGNKVCASSLVFNYALFTDGIITGTSDCFIKAKIFVSSSGRNPIYLQGPDASFIIEDIFSVQDGTLSFEMGHLSGGMLDVSSTLVFNSPSLNIGSTVNIRDSGSVDVDANSLFGKNSVISGDFGGVLSIHFDTVISGGVSFQGCVHVDNGVSLIVDSKEVDELHICSNHGNVIFNNSVVNLLSITQSVGGFIVFEGSTCVQELTIVEHSGGSVEFKDVNVHSLKILSLSGGLIDLTPPSVVLVESIVQSDGLININSSSTVLHQATFTSTGGLLHALNSFNVSNSIFNLLGGDVVIDQFQFHSVNLDELHIVDGLLRVHHDQMFTTASTTMLGGVLDANDLFASKFNMSGGILHEHTNLLTNSLIFTNDGQKVFDSHALATSLIKTTWTGGSVLGHNSSQISIPGTSQLHLLGDDGWFVADSIDINSFISASGPIIFSTYSSIIMEWDIFGKFLTVSKGSVILQDNMVLVEDVLLEFDGSLYLSSTINISSSIVGDGILHIDHSESLVGFNCLVNLTGVLYMKDGILDLRSSTVDQILIDYTGGIILLEYNPSQRIQLTRLEVNFTVSDSELSLVSIEYCDATFTVQNAVITRFWVMEMGHNCQLLFLEGAVVGQFQLDQMHGGYVLFSNGSDVRLNSMTVNDGLVVAELDSSPSFSEAA
ncbi:hypothetical protein GEMRC1_010395 [Eukaryota sp. GEM-RC1]